ncbi:glycosyl transferase [Bombiscardovia nodaiensis]|uniref:Glycosyl transferase n=1 Tax=Bombiscardovia nodaiensis TaxID=2932181 RepID=A0ABM8B9Y5_9BIFI|nr:glycosyl transferase [Bombiscardovia nodaiensis]
MSAGELPVVSAVVTTYQRPVEVVRRALKSVIGQNYPHLEVILVNDCPQDSTLSASLKALCQELSQGRPVTYLPMEHNGGACRARNFGAARAKGSYLAFLDDDDEWLPAKISQELAAAEAHESVGLVYCNAVLHYDAGEKPDGLLAPHPLPSGNIFLPLLGRNFIGSCSFPLIARADFERLGGFNADMPALQDWEFYLRLTRQKEAVYLAEPLARYHFHQGERISAHPERRTAAFEHIHQQYAGDLAAHPRVASSFYLMGTYLYSVAGDMRRAWAYYRRGVRLDPGQLTRNVKDFFRMALRPFVHTKVV